MLGAAALRLQHTPPQQDWRQKQDKHKRGVRMDGIQIDNIEHQRETKAHLTLSSSSVSSSLVR